MDKCVFDNKYTVPGVPYAVFTFESQNSIH